MIRTQIAATIEATQVPTAKDTMLIEGGEQEKVNSKWEQHTPTTTLLQNNCIYRKQHYFKYIIVIICLLECLSGFNSFRIFRGIFLYLAEWPSSLF